MIPEEVAVLADVLDAILENTHDVNIELAWKIYKGLVTTNYRLGERL